ncbi:ATP synthase F1 subunit delta [Desulfothermus okinawensis JCM 13304]
MKQEIIAKRYSRALFAIGQEEGPEALRKYGAELGAFCDLVESEPILLRIFKNPVIRVEDKKVLIGKILDKIGASKVVKNFFMLLAEKKRLPYILDIRNYYQKLLDLFEGIVRGHLVTAIDLNDDKKESIRKSLEEKMAKKFVLDFQVDKGILGGVVLKVGDKVYDASLRAQLNILKEKIKRGE